MACKRRSGEVGEWTEEESFPLPCHSTGLTPPSSFAKMQASEKGREKRRRDGGRASFPIWEAGSIPKYIGLSPVSLVSHPSAAFGLRSRSAELVNSSASTRHLKQIRSLIATQRLMMDGGLYLQQN